MINNRPYRVMIVSASVGSGHQQAALALKSLLETTADCQVDIIDFFGSEHHRLGRLVKAAYFQLLQLFPEVYDFFYHQTDESKYGQTLKSVLYHTSQRYMRSLIRKRRPHVIVFTHPFPCAAAAGLREAGRITVPLVGVVTDFAVHRLWQYDMVDHYCVAADSLKDQMCSQGIIPHRIHATGIPIRPEFGQVNTEARKKGHILIMGGGVGLGPTEELVEVLAKVPGVQRLYVICGENIETYQAIVSKQATLSKIDVYQFTDKVSTLMEECEIIITKPGGLTVSEALAAKLPMVLIDAIGGQEEDNARFLTNAGVALWAHDADGASVYVRRMLSDDSFTLQFRENCANLAKPQAAQNIAAIITDICSKKARS